MKTFLLTGRTKIELAEVAHPTVGEDDVLCKTHYTAISPGTYLQRYLGTQPGMPDYPFVPGYLNVGEVVEVGSQVRDRGFAEGDVVHVRSYVKDCPPLRNCNGTDAEYVVIPGSSLPYVTHVRQNPKHLAFAIFGHLGFSAMMEGQCGVTKSAIVLGQGMLGLGCTRAFAIAGAKQVVAVDRIPKRLEIAGRLGATHTEVAGDGLFDTLKEKYPNGFDIVVEATGSPKVMERIFELSRSGDVLLVSLCNEPVPVYFGNFKCRRVIGLPRDQWWLNLLHRLLDTGLFMVDEIISDVVPASEEEMRWAYEALLEEPEEHLGILVDWTGEAQQRRRLWPSRDAKA